MARTVNHFWRARCSGSEGYGYGWTQRDTGRKERDVWGIQLDTDTGTAGWILYTITIYSRSPEARVPWHLAIMQARSPPRTGNGALHGAFMLHAADRTRPSALRAPCIGARRSRTAIFCRARKPKSNSSVSLHTDTGGCASAAPPPHFPLSEN